MSKIKDLPGPSTSFRATLGPSSFAKKLSRATAAGDLSHLRDNRDSIVKTIKKNETAIRRGTFDRYRQLNALKNIRQLEGAKLTKVDVIKIKKIFRHLSGDEKTTDQTTSSDVKTNRALDKDVGFLEKRWTERKASMSAKMNRFTKSRTGGETELKFINEPQANDRDEKYSVSARLITKRFQAQEQKLQKRLPSHLVNYEEERGKRLEVSSFDNAKSKTEKAKSAGNTKNNLKKDDSSLYQNL